MIAHIILSKRALSELDKIYEYYEKAEEGLGSKFLKKLYKKYNQLSFFPNSGVEKKRTYRESYLEVFPYAVIYRFNSKQNEIFITSIFHFRRNPSKKYKK